MDELIDSQVLTFKTGPRIAPDAEPTLVLRKQRATRATEIRAAIEEYLIGVYGPPLEGFLNKFLWTGLVKTVLSMILPLSIQFLFDSYGTMSPSMSYILMGLVFGQINEIITSFIFFKSWVTTGHIAGRLGRHFLLAVAIIPIMASLDVLITVSGVCSDPQSGSNSSQDTSPVGKRAVCRLGVSSGLAAVNALATLYLVDEFVFPLARDKSVRNRMAVFLFFIFVAGGAVYMGLAIPLALDHNLYYFIGAPEGVSTPHQIGAIVFVLGAFVLYVVLIFLLKPHYIDALRHTCLIEELYHIVLKTQLSPELVNVPDLPADWKVRCKS